MVRSVLDLQDFAGTYDTFHPVLRVQDVSLQYVGDNQWLFCFDDMWALRTCKRLLYSVLFLSQSALRASHWVIRWLFFDLGKGASAVRGAL